MGAAVTMARTKLHVHDANGTIAERPRFRGLAIHPSPERLVGNLQQEHCQTAKMYSYIDCILKRQKWKRFVPLKIVQNLRYMKYLKNTIGFDKKVQQQNKFDGRTCPHEKC